MVETHSIIQLLLSISGQVYTRMVVDMEMVVMRHLKITYGYINNIIRHTDGGGLL